MAIKSYAGVSLKKFTTDIGLPELLNIDGLSDHNLPGTEFMNSFLRNGIQVTRT